MTYQSIIEDEGYIYLKISHLNSERLKVIFTNPERKKDWINPSNLSKKANLSTKVLHDCFTRIILIADTDYRIRARHDLWTYDQKFNAFSNQIQTNTGQRC